ncbi:carbamoyltransferase C-terminal domain-containing protein [Plantactinospora sp. WMMB782]|uniref:carbamoyltransferase C-terminal domain-containing protein n=1 Tax=Plantactinospora sp. WMMB782 TaxID=3404121 RepID=UPI003B9403A5
MKVAAAEPAPRSILALKPGHDGAVALVEDGRLVFSREAEKDSNKRNGPLTIEDTLAAMEQTDRVPDVIAVSGWHRELDGLLLPTGAGYHGLDEGRWRETRYLGQPVRHYSGTHERSHIYSGVAMSSFEPESPLALLVWEGIIGAFYEWHGARRPIRRFPVLTEPGARYAALFCIADTDFPATAPWPDRSAAGKLMAVAGLADLQPPSDESQRLVESLISAESMYPDFKWRNRTTPLYNSGIPSMELARAARYLSNRLFDGFLGAAKQVFANRDRPLVVAGGCGLNCEWNSLWRESGLFTDVFVPPCANDSGSAIGTAMDAYAALGGPCRLEWAVDAGPPFDMNEEPDTAEWQELPYEPQSVGRRLASGDIVAWAWGRAEIGPRALGRRSLLARATDPASRDALNAIKRRDAYRPVAPACLAEDLHTWFDAEFDDPFMLYVRSVRHPDRLPAVTHTDGTARVQSVDTRCAEFRELLLAVRGATGVGVVCNTSLNFPGQGFINSMSDLTQFCRSRGIPHMVVDGRWFRRLH